MTIDGKPYGVNRYTAQDGMGWVPSVCGNGGTDFAGHFSVEITHTSSEAQI